MKYPNLSWAIAERRLTHYQVAAEANMSPTRFSRCASGRSQFSASERLTLASCLGYPAAWLFEEVSPPEHISRLNGGSEIGLIRNEELEKRLAK
jgi:hypothetical protein